MRPLRFARSIVLAASLALAVGGLARADPTDPSQPQIILVTPAEGQLFYQDQPVRAGYGCLPSETGVPAVTCVGDAPQGDFVDTSSVGTQTFTVRATDPFGVVTTLSHSYTVIDRNRPSIDLATPRDHAIYEFGSQVTVQYACDDGVGGSGIILCRGTLPVGFPLPTSTLGTFTFDVTAFDGAFNSASVRVTYQVVDSVPPTISVRTPPPTNGDRLPTYLVGQQVLADYSCSDGAGSGLAFCSAPVASGVPIDTSTVGTHTFTVLADDFAHNVVSLTRRYDVVYPFEGFSPPLAPWPALATISAGDQVPVKFTLKGDYGTGIVSSASSQQIDCSSLAPLSDWTSASSSTAYSAGPDRYKLHWQTDRIWTGTCRQLAVTLDDDTTHRANVRFTK
jgi:hypothetical protein